jgi:hypothetical protein
MIGPGPWSGKPDTSRSLYHAATVAMSCGLVNVAISPLLDTRSRTSDLDQELETARREFSVLERQEAKQGPNQQAEYRRWLAQKETRCRAPLSRFLKVFTLIREFDDDWRREVTRGQETLYCEVERELCNLYAIWLGISQLFHSNAEKLSRHGCEFENEMDHLGRYRREADRLLRTWEPPVLSNVPSFRTPPLSAETTARIRELCAGQA